MLQNTAATASETAAVNTSGVLDQKPAHPEANDAEAFGFVRVDEATADNETTATTASEVPGEKATDSAAVVIGEERTSETAVADTNTAPSAPEASAGSGLAF